MKYYKFVFIITLLLFCGISGFSQTEPTKRLVSRSTIPPGPLCLLVFKDKTYIIENRLVDSLVRPKNIKSLKIENDAKVTAIYGSRAANGLITIIFEDKKANKELDRMKPYLKPL